MTVEQVERKIIELIYREPFAPFVCELSDGTDLQVSHPRLAINGGGAMFFGPEGGLVDFEFANVRAIRTAEFDVLVESERRAEYYDRKK